MKAILFCANPYAFGILKPLHDELLTQGHDMLWYVPEKIVENFPFKKDCNHTGQIKNLYDYQSDAIFVPGNEVPHYLRGVKVQVFHGMAGEKEGHFRIRNYFDLYLTQGPYFTTWFDASSKKHGDFEVKETGWCKLDPLYQRHAEFLNEGNRLLHEHGKKKLVLYAPTFSPSLTSATTSLHNILELADQEDVFLLIKFHDLMNAGVVEDYRQKIAARKNVRLIEDRNILKYMIMADLMISDTSSVVYEFILLDKPVITIRSNSSTINWHDIKNSNELLSAFRDEIANDSFKEKRSLVISQYHPYTDGKSSSRMIAATENYIRENGIPEKRKVNLWRRFKLNSMFGPSPA